MISRLHVGWGIHLFSLRPVYVVRPTQMAEARLAASEWQEYVPRDVFTLVRMNWDPDAPFDHSEWLTIDVKGEYQMALHPMDARGLVMVVPPGTNIWNEDTIIRPKMIRSVCGERPSAHGAVIVHLRRVLMQALHVMPEWCSHIDGQGTVGIHSWYRREGNIAEPPTLDMIHGRSYYDNAVMTSSPALVLCIRGANWLLAMRSGRNESLTWCMLSTWSSMKWSSC